MNNNPLHKILIKTTLVVAVLLATTLPAPAQNDYWHQRVSLFAKLPIESTDIVFLGNSITDGGEFQELFNRDDVKNRGIVGDVINNVRKRLDQVTDGHPAKIFLLIGINDVSHGLTAERIADRYEALVKEIREKSPETTLYIQSVLPINNDFRRYRNLLGREDVIPALNEKLQVIAGRNGAVYVDLWPSFADENGKLQKRLTSDGLHLSGNGYKVWVAAVRNLVESPAVIISDTDSESGEAAMSEGDNILQPAPVINKHIE